MLYKLKEFPLLTIQLNGVKRILSFDYNYQACLLSERISSLIVQLYGVPVKGYYLLINSVDLTYDADILSLLCCDMVP